MFERVIGLAGYVANFEGGWKIESRKTLSVQEKSPKQLRSVWSFYRLDGIISGI